jgi:hypothetical protein
MTPASCLLCLYYTPDLNPQAAPGNGICRRKTPVPVLIPQGAFTVWPTVKPTDWCGEGEAGISHDTKAMGNALLDKGNGHRH